MSGQRTIQSDSPATTKTEGSRGRELAQEELSEIIGGGKIAFKYASTTDGRDFRRVSRSDLSFG